MTKRLSRLLSEVAAEVLTELKDKHNFTDKELDNDSDLSSLIDPKHDRDPEGEGLKEKDFQEPTPVRNWN